MSFSVGFVDGARAVSVPKNDAAGDRPSFGADYNGEQRR